MGGGVIQSTGIAYADNSTSYYETEIKTPNLGNYQFEVEAHEKPSHETLPIISKDYFPKTIATFATEVDNTAPSAKYKSKPIVKVDVVFALGELAQTSALQNYIPRFTSTLETASNNIDARVEQVKTSTISTSDAGADKIFGTWENYPDSSGQWTFNTSNNSIGSTQNVGWTGFWDNSSEALQSTDIVIEYKSKEELRVRDCAPARNFTDITCHPDPMGFTFRMTKSNGTYSYYAFSIYAYQQVAVLARVDQTGNPNSAQNGVVAPWTNTIPNLGANGKSGLVTQLGYSDILYNPITEHSVKIEAKANNIKVYYDGSLLFNVTDNINDYLKSGGYGPFTFSMPNGNFYDIKITRGATKSLGEAISDVSWRDNSVRFVVHATDIIPKDMQDTNSADYQYTVTKLYNSNAYLINLGTYVNRSVLDGLVRDIMGTDGDIKGTFFYNSSISSAMDQSSSWIINKVTGLAKPTDWLLVNQEIIWENDYNDNEHDVPLNFGGNNYDSVLQSNWGISPSNRYSDDKVLAEKWRYSHNPGFYDNSTVTATFSKNWIPDPVDIFQNPGLYRVNYKRLDNPMYPDTSISNLFNNYRYWSTDYDRRAGK